MDRLLEKIMKDQATTCSQSNFESEGIWSEFGKKKKVKKKERNKLKPQTVPKVKSTFEEKKM